MVWTVRSASQLAACIERTAAPCLSLRAVISRGALRVRSLAHLPLSAAELSRQIGSYHVDLSIDTVVEAVVSLFSLAVSGGVRPRFKAHGGTISENLALQVGFPSCL
jgi:hypothetical protein